MKLVFQYPLKKRYAQLFIPFLLVWMGISACARADVAHVVYAQFCASCHGKAMEGGSASSLIDGNWQYGSSDAAITQSIVKGISDAGMPAWGDTLSIEQIDSLVKYIKGGRELNQKATLSRADETAQDAKLDTQSASIPLTLKTLATMKGDPWSLDFLPDGRALIAIRQGELLLFDNGKKIAINDIPEVSTAGQGGLLGVKLHPDYVSNGWIYLAFSHGINLKSMTKIVRGKIKNNRWVNQQTIFEAPASFYTRSKYHYGVRLVFDNNYLFFGIGDRGRQDQAQDITRPNGKIHRVFDDGRIPKDNPFVDEPSAFASIWTYGNRNPQGLTLAADGSLWAAEHGPKGGDEINLIEKGKNYGWPVITYGINYNGTPITDKTHQEGMEQPKYYWVPSIAVSNIAFYQGDTFKRLNNKLLVASLKAQQLEVLTRNNNAIVNRDILMKDIGRIRDIQVEDNGHIYLLLSDRANNTGQLVQLVK